MARFWGSSLPSRTVCSWEFAVPYWSISRLLRSGELAAARTGEGASLCSGASSVPSSWTVRSWECALPRWSRLLRSGELAALHSGEGTSLPSGRFRSGWDGTSFSACPNTALAAASLDSSFFFAAVAASCWGFVACASLASFVWASFALAIMLELAWLLGYGRDVGPVACLCTRSYAPLYQIPRVSAPPDSFAEERPCPKSPVESPPSLQYARWFRSDRIFDLWLRKNVATSHRHVHFFLSGTKGTSRRSAPGAFFG